MAEDQFLNRHHFAEFAESLGVSTDCIWATTQKDGSWWVIYTTKPTEHPEEWIWCATLRPDNHRVLRVTGRRQIQKIRDFNDDVQDLMRRATPD